MTMQVTNNHCCTTSENKISLKKTQPTSRPAVPIFGARGGCIIPVQYHCFDMNINTNIKHDLERDIIVQTMIFGIFQKVFFISPNFSSNHVFMLSKSLFLPNTIAWCNYNNSNNNNTNNRNNDSNQHCSVYTIQGS